MGHRARGVWCRYGRSTSWKIPVQPVSANCSPIITCEITPEGHSDHMWDVLRSEDRSVSDGNSGHVTKPSLGLDRCRVEGDQIPVAGTVNKIILMAGLEQQECTTCWIQLWQQQPRTAVKDRDALIVPPLPPTDGKVCLLRFKCDRQQSRPIIFHVLSEWASLLQTLAMGSFLDENEK